MFFLGQFYHNLDEKGRLTIPSRFREALAIEGGYVLQGFDQNLMVLTSVSFESISRRVNQMSMADPKVRLLRRLLFSNASQIEIDRAGRMLIPQILRQAAGLVDEAVVVGMSDYFEIWSPDLWAQQMSQLNDSESNAQRFGAMDIFFGS
jgi:MraZ protein